jgi:pantothenate kinase
VSSVSELAALALALRGRVPLGRPVMLGIVGPPGSGKSTLTDALLGALTHWSLVQMDGFHLSNEVLLALGRRDRKGAPDTFDVGGFVSLLARVRMESGVVYGPRFRREIEEPIAGSIAIDCASVGVLVEGNYLLYDDYGWSAVAPMLDAIWYVDTPSDECRSRLVERASITYGPVDGPAWVANVDEPNAALVRACRMRADHRVTLEL